MYVVRKKGLQGKFRGMKYSWGYFINHNDETTRIRWKLRLFFFLGSVVATVARRDAFLKTVRFLELPCSHVLAIARLIPICLV